MGGEGRAGGERHAAIHAAAAAALLLLEVVLQGCLLLLGLLLLPLVLLLLPRSPACGQLAGALRRRRRRCSCRGAAAVQHLVQPLLLRLVLAAGCIVLCHPRLILRLLLLPVVPLKLVDEARLPLLPLARRRRRCPRPGCLARCRLLLLLPLLVHLGVCSHLRLKPARRHACRGYVCRSGGR